MRSLTGGEWSLLIGVFLGWFAMCGAMVYAAFRPGRLRAGARSGRCHHHKEK